MEKTKLSKEEKFIKKLERDQERERRRQEKLAKQIEKENLIKEEPTESELVHRYVNRVIKNQQYHGRIDKEKFEGLEYEKTVSKNLWLDTDFYFSVVFASKQQKYEFLEKWEQFCEGGIEFDFSEVSKVQIINGPKLAKALGIELKEETSKNYPTGHIDLMPYVLDNFKG